MYQSVGKRNFVTSVGATLFDLTYNANNDNRLCEKNVLDSK